MSKREIGLQRIKEILGENTPDKLEALFGDIAPDLNNYLYDFTYGELYARKGLPDKTLEVAAVASLLGQRNVGLPLKSHFIAMLNVGWQKQDIVELLLFLTNYVGFPTIVEAVSVLKEALQEKME